MMIYEYLFGRRNLIRNLWGSVLDGVLLTACAVGCGATQPQDSQVQQDQSVAGAARRNREQNKNATGQSKVITNDDLDTGHNKSDEEGLNVAASVAPRKKEPSASGVAAKEADHVVASAQTESGPKDKESEEIAAERGEIVVLMKQLDEAENGLKLQKRELALDQNTIYSNPRYTTTHVGKAKLDSDQLEIDEKQQEIERIKGLLGELEWRQWSRQKIGQPPSISHELPPENSR
jgi:hypothetical protein